MTDPTDDVKALIAEARGLALTPSDSIVACSTYLDGAARVTMSMSQVHKTFAAAVEERDRLWALCDRLATALSTADAAGYARGVEEAARVADDWTEEDHIAADMRAGIFPNQSPTQDAIAAVIRALSQEKK